jgi:hypothetical protein
MYDENEKIMIDTGYRVPPGSLETSLFLDYIMVLTKSMDFSCLKDRSKTFRFYPKHHQKKLPTKYFNEFDPIGHTFYIGKYHDLDCFIVAEPNIECNCNAKSKERGTSGCVEEDIAAIIMEEVILKSLSVMDDTVLTGRNVTISNSFENFTGETFQEFRVDDFDDAVLNLFKTSWTAIEHDFFTTHTPRLCFSRFGQNIQLNDEV